MKNRNNKSNWSKSVGIQPEKDQHVDLGNDRGINKKDTWMSPGIWENVLKNENCERDFVIATKVFYESNEKTIIWIYLNVIYIIIVPIRIIKENFYL